jgi:hypothetical protein
MMVTRAPLTGVPAPVGASTFPGRPVAWVVLGGNCGVARIETTSGRSGA